MFILDHTRHRGATAAVTIVGIVALGISGCTSATRSAATEPLTTHASSSASGVATPELVYSNGVRITLLGVSEFPVKGKSWWRPDGQLLAGPPYDISKEPPHSESESFLFPWSSFALQVSNPQHLQLKWRLESSCCSEAWFTAKDGFKTNDGILRIASSFMKISDVARLQFGVPLEPWQTRMTASPDERAFGIRGHVTGRILSMPSAENGGTFRFSLTHDFRDREARVVVVTAGGQPHVFAVGEKDRSKDIAPVFSASGYKPGEIREIQFQTCRFEWKEFAGVLLHPKGWTPGTPRWATLRTAELPFETKEVGNWLYGQVTFSNPRQDRGRTLVDAKYMAPAGWQTRVVAITADGAVHPSDLRPKRLSNGVVIAHAEFPKLPLDQVRTFALQVETDK